MFRIATILSLALTAASLPAHAKGFTDTPVGQMLAKALADKYPLARIEFEGIPEGISMNTAQQAVQVTAASEEGAGKLRFSVSDGSASPDKVGLIGFRAYVLTPVASRRIRPLENITKDVVTLRELDVTQGEYRDVRGLLLPAQTEVSSLQSRQTILEGQPVLASAVERIPDMKRGEIIRVRMVIGGLTVSTTATAEESATIGSSAKVVTQSTKRTLSGTLVEHGTVEVRL